MGGTFVAFKEAKPMTPVLMMASHAAVAGAAFFLFQRYALGASVETSALWAIVGAVSAAALAWSQNRRGR